MQSMFTITGMVIHVFVAPKGVDKSTGEEFGGQDKVQILGDIPVGGDQYKKEIVTLTTYKGSEFQKHMNKMVRVPVSFWVRDGNIGYYIPKNSEIKLVTAGN